MPEECGLEQRKPRESHSLLTSTGHTKRVEIRKLHNCEDFSSKEPLLRVTAQVLMCAKVWKSKTGRCEAEYTKNITSLVLQESEDCWVREIVGLTRTQPKDRDMEAAVWSIC